MPDPILAPVKDLGVLVGETIADDDAKALLLLRTASGIVRAHCRQKLHMVVNDVIRRTPIAGHTVFLPEFPIVSVTSLQRRTLPTWTTIPVARYGDVDEETGRLQLAHGGYDRGPWQITYTHGFDHTPAEDGSLPHIPDDIQGAVLGLASRAWETPIGVDNERIGQRSIKYLMLDSGFDPLEEAALAQYRHVSVA